MEDILPVCFQIRLITTSRLTNVVIFLVIFPPGRKLIRRPGTPGLVIQHFPLIEMVPDVLKAHQSVVIGVNDLMARLVLVFTLQTQ
jgi:hypothetical protein